MDPASNTDSRLDSCGQDKDDQRRQVPSPLTLSDYPVRYSWPMDRVLFARLVRLFGVWRQLGIFLCNYSSTFGLAGPFHLIPPRTLQNDYKMAARWQTHQVLNNSGIAERCFAATRSPI